MLDRLAVPNVRSGIILELADRQWIVDEAASGVDGLLLALAITMFYAFSARRSTLSIVNVAGSGPLLGHGGLGCPRCRCRVPGGPAGENLSRGWPNAVPGLVAVATTLALVWSTDRLLWILAVPSGTFDTGINRKSRAQSGDPRDRGHASFQSRGLFPGGSLRHSGCWR